MQYTEIMVRYGELSTKGKNRRSFIDRLGTNVRHTLHDFKNLDIKANRDRMHIQLNGEDSDKVISRLRDVFGIQSLFTCVWRAKEVDHFNIDPTLQC